MNGCLEAVFAKSLSERLAVWATTGEPLQASDQPGYIGGVEGCVLIGAEGDRERHILTCVLSAHESLGLECYGSPDVGA